MDKTTERVPNDSIDDLPKKSIDELTDEEIVAILRVRFKSKFALIAYESKGGYLFVSTYAPGGKTMVSNLQKAWEEKFGHIEVL
jgi:hypothetical protein